MKTVQILWHRRNFLLLLLGVLLPLYGFGKLAEEIWEQEDGFPWDVPLLLWLHANAQPQLDFLASLFNENRRLLGYDEFGQSGGWGAAGETALARASLFHSHAAGQFGAERGTGFAGWLRLRSASGCACF